LFLSTPFDEFMGGLEDVNGSSDAHVEHTSGYSRTVFDIFFAGMGIVPVIWFIVEIFKREPDWGYRR